MRHQVRRCVALGFMLAGPGGSGHGAGCRGAERARGYPIPPVMVLPTVRVASVEADGKIRLESIPERPAFWQTTEGYYLIMSPPTMPFQPPTGARPGPIDGLLRIEVVEVVEGNKLTAKSSPEAAKMLKVGDLVSLVRPAGMTTAQIRELPAVLPHPKEGDAKAGGGLTDSLARARQAARLAQSVNNLKQMGLAMHNFHSTFNNFPPAVVFGPDGKPWHSWRVLILPYLEQSGIYNQYDFSQPWDSPKNRALIDKMPSVYRDPLNGETTGSSTHYSVLVGEGRVALGGCPPRSSHRSVRADLTHTARHVMQASCRTAHRVDRHRRPGRVTLQEPPELIPGDRRHHGVAVIANASQMSGRHIPESRQRNRVACDPVVGEVADQLLAQRLVLVNLGRCR